jgi:hypothetical protein
MKYVKLNDQGHRKMLVSFVLLRKKCYNMAMECAKNLKNNFSKVGAFSSEQKFICGDSDGVIQWINDEVKLSRKFLVAEETSVPLPMPVGPCLFWRWLVAIMPSVGAKAKTPPFARRLRRPRCTNGDKTMGRLTLRPHVIGRRHVTRSSHLATSSNMEAHV